MTREEAIALLCYGDWLNVISEHIGKMDTERIAEAMSIVGKALRPVSRKQVEKMFPGCPYCDMAKANDNIYNKALWVKEAKTSKWTLAGKSLQYCPICGRPLTDEAVQMVMERLEALKDGKDDND